MIADFFKISLNNLKRRKLRSWLTMLGIFIGIAAVVSLISLGQGLQTAVTSQFSSLSTDKLTIQNSGTGFGPPGSTAVTKLNEHDVKIIESVSGVEFVIPRLIRNGQVEYNRNAQYKYIGSLPEDKKLADVIYKSGGLEPEKGRLLLPGDSGKVILGSDVITKDSFGKVIETGKSIVIQGKSFQVIGILKKASSFELNQVVIMLDSDIRNLLDVPKGETDLIIAQVKNPDEIAKVADDIEKAMRKDRGEKIGEEDFSVQTPLEAISSVNTILTSINIVVIGIAMISLIVGGIGIANTMYTSVLERKKEIGTMKAIGARNSDVLLIFLIESGLLGLAGGFIGVLLGVGISLGVASVANSAFGSEIIKLNISTGLLLFAFGFSFLIGILSGAVPSYQASKLKPVDALRG